MKLQKEGGSMKDRKEVIAFCNTFFEVYRDEPFHDPNWTVMRHKANQKVFAWIFEKDGYMWVNVKCNPEWRDFWRSVYQSVLPGYHLNKEHWNSIILDGTVKEEDVKQMIEESYYLTKPKKPKKKIENTGKKGESNE